MGGLYGDLRFGLRLILKNPAAVIAVIIVLALGIGAKTAIFTIVDCVLIRPLPYANPEQLTMLWETEPEITKAPVTGPDYEDWKTTSRSFQSIAGGTEALFNLTGSGEPLRLDGFSVGPYVPGRREPGRSRTRSGSQRRSMAARFWRRPRGDRAENHSRCQELYGSWRAACEFSLS